MKSRSGWGTVSLISSVSLISLASLVTASSLLLSACVVEPVRPPQPEPRVEVVPVAPATGYHWVKGHYRWEGNHWGWVGGHWAPGY
ncbi:YXWGXW repeat-containing protein [Paraburkholderia sp.]|uniref:YXWGXW repeat-containing protein n=1 Tax=Paraburkholderia sp. TaxID=1926495 RepID=UPI003D6FEEC5